MSVKYIPFLISHFYIFMSFMSKTGVKWGRLSFLIFALKHIERGGSNKQIKKKFFPTFSVFTAYEKSVYCMGAFS